MGIKAKLIYKCSHCGALYDDNHTVGQCQKKEQANRKAGNDGRR